MKAAKREAMKFRLSPQPAVDGAEIHPTAVIDPGAELGAGVSVGAYSIIGAEVALGEGSVVMNHVTIQGPTAIGRENRFYPYCSIGHDPQDKKYLFEGPSTLAIGDNNVFREFVTVHRGTPHGQGVTRIGNANWILNYVHIGHDCQIGDQTIFANHATLGGHVTVGDRAYLGGFTAVHPLCSLGEQIITGGHTMIAQDVPPFVTASGNRAQLYGINKIGMERQGFSAREILNMQRAYKIFFRSGLPAQEALTQLDAEFGDSRCVNTFTDFIRNSQRGICR